MRLLLVCVALFTIGVQPSMLHDRLARQLQAVEATRCPLGATEFFLKNIDAASSGCAVKTSYEWQGSADPSNAQRKDLCKCSVKPFEVPDCTWKKQGQYVVTVAQHTKYVLNCTGKVTPTITVVPVSQFAPTTTTKSPQASNSTEPSAGSASSSTGDEAEVSIPSTDEVSTPLFPLSTLAEPNAPRCNDYEAFNFQTNVRVASNYCLEKDTYDWAGTIDPSDEQISKICKCTFGLFTIPNCKVRKGTYLVLMETHYGWVRDKCKTLPKESSSKATLIGGIVGGMVVIVILLGLLFYKHRQSRAQKHSPRFDDSIPELASPINYEVVPPTPQDVRVSKPRVTKRRATSGDSAGRLTSSSTATGSSSLGERPSLRESETVSWDDPAITAARIAYDAIFFASLLSRGGFGEVYVGTYKGENVAIKQLRPERRKDMVQIEKFLAEVKLMSSLDHEHIVRFIGVAWITLSDVCMVVEYLDNGDLRSVLNRWEEDIRQKKRCARSHGYDAEKTKIALHIAHALAYLHSLQPLVVHRDLKPANILLNRNYDAKLTDFGISRERGESTMTANVGSMLWMAPEVMLGERYDEKADIFSFGVVLSELDTHLLPYAHVKETATGEKIPDAAIMQQVMLGHVEVAFTDGADLEMAALGRECVSLVPNDRPTAAQLLYRVHQIHRKYT